MKFDRRRKPLMKSLIMKQSVSINGHHSSVTIKGRLERAQGNRGRSKYKCQCYRFENRQ